MKGDNHEKKNNYSFVLRIFSWTNFGIAMIYALIITYYFFRIAYLINLNDGEIIMNSIAPYFLRMLFHSLLGFFTCLSMFDF